MNLKWHFDKLHNQQPGEPREHQGEVLQGKSKSEYKSSVFWGVQVSIANI